MTTIDYHEKLMIKARGLQDNRPQLLVIKVDNNLIFQFTIIETPKELYLP
jgi:hypothetical protein